MAHETLTISRCVARADYQALLADPAFEVRWRLEQHLALRFADGKRRADGPTFVVPGFCAACRHPVDFRGDFTGAWTGPDGIRVPNWRESLSCPDCRLIARQRMAVGLMREAVGRRAAAPPPVVYLMEARTPLFAWAEQHLPCRLIGSEYLGPTQKAGAVRAGVRHEDAEQLSFADASIDVVVSCDVLEHVPRPARAFAEIARVLVSGGEAVLTFPMDLERDTPQVRAELRDGQIHHLHPPAYHRQPHSDAGCLVFTDFGWSVLDDVRRAGLTDVSLDVYWSYAHGYLGMQYHVRATKP